jgi:Na+/phosphate symporter
MNHFKFKRWPLIAMLAALLLTSCEQDEPENKEGITLDNELLARNEEQIPFKRTRDGSLHNYKIEQLDAASQAQIRKFPATGIQYRANTLPSKGLPQTESLHIQNLQQEITKAQKTIEQLQYELAQTTSLSAQRTLEKEIAQNEAIILQNSAEIRRRQ